VVWLYANNRIDEAEQIIRNAAKLNHVTMPDKILARPDAAVDTMPGGGGDRQKGGGKLMDRFRILTRSKKSSEKTEGTTAQYTMLDIFRNRHLTVNTLCMAFLWSVHSCISA